MIPLEVLTIVLGAAFVIVGLSRGFSRELGATIGFVTLLLVLDLTERFIWPFAAEIAPSTATPNLGKWILYTTLVGVTVLVTYHGEGLAFGGLPPRGILGAVLSIFAGALNGWLVVGTWWHYTDRFDYPIRHWGLFTPPLSEAAQWLVARTPMALLPAERSWLYLTLFLVFLLLLKVVR